MLGHSASGPEAVKAKLINVPHSAHVGTLFHFPAVKFHAIFRRIRETLLKVTIRSFMSIFPNFCLSPKNNLFSIGRIFVKLYTEEFNEICHSNPNLIYNGQK
jgi:hypothetical protein